MTETHASPKGRPENDSGHFTMLMCCMILSMALLAISRFTIDRMNGALPNWLSVLGGIAPLVYYHLFYLAPRARSGLSQAAIDSVYYYGFLVTIFALGTSALSMVSGSSEVALANPGAVIAQFGVGLLATGYAIVARLHLSSHSSQLGDATPDEVIDRYIGRSRQLLERLDETLHRFSDLAEKSEIAIKAVERVTSDSVQHNGAALKAMAGAFQIETGQIFAQMKDSLTETRGMISDPTFTDERKAFVLSMKAIANSARSLETEMQNLIKANQGAISASHSLSQEAQSVSESFGKIELRLDSAAQGAEQVAAALTNAEQKITSSSDELKKQIGMSSNAMSDDLQRATAASQLLVQKIVEIAEIVIERTKQVGTGP